ncbi:hypothetical protein C9374_000344 [Naegleria lovaniensis]|uniref:Teneurin NHL domain-containing protein n=1 Tax=Naegleria lovaniensis TaxID=51637 RepID=A0AA88GXM1_NAELO|nr:uncharacterized protein C9374_000344 [Naegleria lovaniensis]KAG2388905.1 hypothetical protein C9374_000344 [Naegleria lovaniensis]
MMKQHHSGRVMQLVLLLVLSVFSFTHGQLTPVAPSYNITNIGGGFGAGDGYSPLLASMGLISGLSFISQNLYVTDGSMNLVRKIDMSNPQNPLIQTIAGVLNGKGYNGDNLLATLATLSSPSSIAFNALTSDIYVCEQGSHRIRKIDSQGLISTIAGTGQAGFNGDNIVANTSMLNSPSSIAISINGDLFVSDTNNHRIRKISLSTMIITTICGNGIDKYSGDDGPANLATLNGPTSISFSSNNELLIADTLNMRIRKIAQNGMIYTVAGNGTQGYDGDGNLATACTLNTPKGLALTLQNDILISDTLNHVIRKVTVATGVIDTIVGSGVAGFSGDGSLPRTCQLNSPMGLAFSPNSENSELYIADQSNRRVRKVSFSTNTITTIAGRGQEELFNGDSVPADMTNLASPLGVSLSLDEQVIVSDYGYQRIRSVNVKNGRMIDTMAGSGTPGFSGDNGSAKSASFNYPSGIFMKSNGDLLISDTFNHRIRKIDASNGVITTIAGTDSTFGEGDTNSQNSMLNYPNGIAVSTLTREVYISDTRHHRIRKIDANGRISTVVGTGVAGDSGADGVTSGTLAQINAPRGIAISEATNEIYFADSLNNKIKKINGNSGTVITVAGNGQFNFSGDGGLALDASLGTPTDVALSLATNELFIADSKNIRIRKLSLATGIITTISGNGTFAIDPASGDFGNAQNALFREPTSISLTSSGNELYIADPYSSRIRKIDFISGIITTVAGGGSSREENSAAIDWQLTSPVSVHVSPDNSAVYIVDQCSVKKVLVSTGNLTTIAGLNAQYRSCGYDGEGLATSRKVNRPMDVALYTPSNGEHQLYIADANNNRVRKVSLTSGMMTTVVGGVGDGGLAVNARLFFPRSVFSSSMDGSIYIADSGNNRIRKINESTGIIETIAGIGTAGYNGDFSDATSAMLNAPNGVVVSKLGEVYIADSQNHRIRKIFTNGTIITIAGTGTAGYNGDQIRAIDSQLNYPTSLLLSKTEKYLWIADTNNHRIRRISLQNGIMTTVAGNGIGGFVPNTAQQELVGVDATTTLLNGPHSLTFTKNGEIYFVDSQNGRLRLLSPSCGYGFSWNSATDECHPCPLGYTGYSSKCNVPICFGISNDSSLVCNSRSGNCLAPDRCQCMNGFYGLDCTIPFCATNLFNSSSTTSSQNYCPQDGSSSNSQQQTQTKSEIIPTLQDLGAKFINFTKDESVKAQLPESISQHLIEKGLNASEKVTLLSSIYQPVASVESRSDVEAPLVSSVLTISLFDKKGAKISISELKDPIELSFSNIVVESTNNKDFNYSCMYFDEIKKDWSLDGLLSEVSNLEISTKTVKFNIKCKTYHLTSFGIIDQNFKRATKPTQSSNGNVDNSSTILAIVLSAVGSLLVLSVIVLIVVVVIALYVRAAKKRQAEKI